MKKTIVLALAAIMVLGVAGAAFADSVTIPGTPSGTPPVWSAAGTVNVKAKVNPKITLTLGTTEGDATNPLLLTWDITPDTSEPMPKNVTLTVSSNKGYSIARTPLPGDAGVPTSLAAAGISFDFTGTALPASGSKGKDAQYTDTVNLTAPDWWQVEPGDYTGSITYTVTQQ